MFLIKKNFKSCMSKFTDTNGLSYNCFRPASEVSKLYKFWYNGTQKNLKTQKGFKVSSLSDRSHLTLTSLHGSIS